MLQVHHLNNSRSQRILWLLEELGTPYEIIKYQRGTPMPLAPPELKKVHPLGKSPVVTDGANTVAESGAIVEYLVERHGGGRLAPAPGQAGTPQIVGCNDFDHMGLRRSGAQFGQVAARSVHHHPPALRQGFQLGPAHAVVQPMRLPREGEVAGLERGKESAFVDGLVVLARVAGIPRDGAPRAVWCELVRQRGEPALENAVLPGPRGADDHQQAVRMCVKPVHVRPSANR